MTFRLGTNAVHDRRPNPTFDLEKKTSTSRTTGLDDSTNANHIYETADDTNKDTTERFSPIWNDIQGIYPGTVSNAELWGLLARRVFKASKQKY